MLTDIVAAAILYGILGLRYSGGQLGFGAADFSPAETLGNLLYFSTVVFTTVGFGDFTPVGASKGIMMLQGLSGQMVRWQQKCWRAVRGVAVIGSSGLRSEVSFMGRWAILTIMGVTIGLVCPNLYADSLYTWTDSKGQTHITQHPPPPGAALKDTIDYVPQSESAVEPESKPYDFESSASQRSPSSRATEATTEENNREVFYDGGGGRYTRRAIKSELHEQTEKPRPKVRKHKHKR